MKRRLSIKTRLMTAEQLRGGAKPPAPTAPGKSREMLKGLTESKKKGTQAGLHRPELLGPSITTDAEQDGRVTKISPQIKPNTQGNHRPPNPLLSNALVLPFAISQPRFWKVSKSPPTNPSQCTMAFNNCSRFSPGKPGKHPQFITRVTFRALSPQMIFTHFNLTPIQNRSAVSSLNSIAPSMGSAYG